MEKLNNIFATNLIRLRKAKGLTQLELANELNYSDRNISKWENAQALPTTEVLVELSKFFEVSIDYLLSQHNDDDLNKLDKKNRESTRDRLLIMGLTYVCVYLLATICFVVTPKFWSYSWLSFIYAVPACAILTIVFVSIWFKKFPNLFIAITILVWSILACVYLSLLNIGGFNLWFLFLLGVPLQVAIVMWSRLSYYHENN